MDAVYATPVHAQRMPLRPLQNEAQRGLFLATPGSSVVKTGRRKGLEAFSQQVCVAPSDWAYATYLYDCVVPSGGAHPARSGNWTTPFRRDRPRPGEVFQTLVLTTKRLQNQRFKLQQMCAERDVAWSQMVTDLRAEKGRAACGAAPRDGPPPLLIVSRIAHDVFAPPVRCPARSRRPHPRPPQSAYGSRARRWRRRLPQTRRSSIGFGPRQRNGSPRGGLSARSAIAGAPGTDAGPRRTARASPSRTASPHTAAARETARGAATSVL